MATLETKNTPEAGEPSPIGELTQLLTFTKAPEYGAFETAVKRVNKAFDLILSWISSASKNKAQFESRKHDIALGIAMLQSELAWIENIVPKMVKLHKGTEYYPGQRDSLKARNELCKKAFAELVTRMEIQNKAAPKAERLRVPVETNVVAFPAPAKKENAGLRKAA